MAANATKWIEEMSRVRAQLEEELVSRLGSDICKANFPGDRRSVLPNTLSIRVEGHQGWQVLGECGGKLEASTASACHSGSCASPSLVLLNSGLTETQALATIRLSVGCHTSESDVKKAADVIHQAVKNLES